MEHSVGSLGVDTKKLGMWTFIGSEVMLFTGLITTYLVFRGKSLAGPYPRELFADPTIVAINTLVLLMSSLTMVLALSAVERGDRKQFFQFILATDALGALFLSVQVYEYKKLIEEGLNLGVNMFGASFFTLTGFHGAHVAVGVMLLLSTALRGARYGFTKEFPLGVEMIGLYWHFVDLVWVVIFTLVYLLK
ncbi:MAG: heme-copper oxidase subunit III [Chloroflexi bacterium]|nr:heme-copper oxidase subunit III [Chloroflexota bacterium]